MAKHWNLTGHQSNKKAERENFNNVSGHLSTSLLPGVAIAVKDTDSMSIAAEEILDLADSSEQSFTRQNPKLSVELKSLLGDDAIEWICVRRHAKGVPSIVMNYIDNEEQSNTTRDYGAKEIRNTEGHLASAGIVFSSTCSVPQSMSLSFRRNRFIDNENVATSTKKVDDRNVRSREDHLQSAGIMFSAAATNQQRMLNSTGQHDTAEVSRLRFHGQNNQFLQNVSTPAKRPRPPPAGNTGPLEDMGETLTHQRKRAMRDACQNSTFELHQKRPTTGHIIPLSDAIRMPTAPENHNYKGKCMLYCYLIAKSFYPNPLRVYIQVECLYYLVPDLLQVTNCGFYWGAIDQYEAKKLLDGSPEGTFLLRDSAQEDIPFTVSWRQSGQTVHVRIPEYDHRYRFTGLASPSSPSVLGLIQHQKNRCSHISCNPLLIFPLYRTFPFSLKHLCRSAIHNKVTYDAIDMLELPNSLKDYLRHYHNRLKLRVRKVIDYMPD